MSGSLRVLPADALGGPTTTTTCSSTRAAGCASTTRAASAACTGRPATRSGHRLLAGLGPEPLERDFDGDYLPGVRGAGGSP